MPYEWTPAARDEVRKLWAAGHSGSQIAAAIGTTKNSVIGVVHRMGLPSRPSPINLQGDGSVRVLRKREAQMPLPPLKSVEAMMREPTPPQRKGENPHPERLSMGGRGTRAVPPQLVAPAEQEAATGRVVPCCWPLWGNEARPKYWFCIAPSVPGKPYCAAHCQQAYTKVGDKIDMAPWLGQRLSSGVQTL